MGARPDSNGHAASAAELIDLTHSDDAVGSMSDDSAAAALEGSPPRGRSPRKLSKQSPAKRRSPAKVKTKPEVAGNRATDAHAEPRAPAENSPACMPATRLFRFIANPPSLGDIVFPYRTPHHLPCDKSGNRSTGPHTHARAYTRTRAHTATARPLTTNTTNTPVPAARFTILS